jgi:hypothetical protein
MANYADAKNAFLGILNRKDITPSQIDTFMQMGIQRTQRILRIPAMEKVVQFTVDNNWTTGVTVPGDLIELISIDNDVGSSDPQKLRRVDLQTAMRKARTPGIPEVFARNGANFVIGYKPSPGTLININYFASLPQLSADADTNWFTNGAEDLLIYGALTFSSDYFLDERKAAFEDRYNSIIADLNDMAARDELSDAAVVPAYYTDGD